MHLSAVNFHDWRPSSISTPKISHVTKNGQWLGVNKKGNHTTHIGSFESKGKMKMKMTIGKLLSDNNNNSTNKQTKSWAFRRQYLWNINNSLYNNNAWLFVLESNRCPRANVIFLFFSEDSNAPLLNEPRFKGRLSLYMECGLKIGLYSVTWWT